MNVAIIGGSGKMGQWFARFLLNEGNQVLLIGRDEKKLLPIKEQLGVEISTSMATVGQADAVILSVPIDSFETVVQQVVLHTHPDHVIVDITSIKAKPVEIMHRHIKAGQILGTHPVFGPGAKSIANQNFVLTPTNEQETALAGKVRQYLEERGARVSLMTPNEHDEMMAVVLGLAHFIAIVSGDTLLSFDKFKQMKEIGGTTYRALLTLVESVLSEDPELYASLQMNLPGMSEIEERFQQGSKTWTDLIKNGDRREFVNRMSTLRDRFEKADPDFGKAYENMYRLLEPH